MECDRSQPRVHPDHGTGNGGEGAGPPTPPLCLGRTGDAALAEEVAQDALAALVERWRRAGAPDCPAAFAFAVARRRAGRLMLRRRLLEPLQRLREAASRLPGPERSAAAEDRARPHLAALRRLPRPGPRSAAAGRRRATSGRPAAPAVARHLGAGAQDARAPGEAAAEATLGGSRWTPEGLTGPRLREALEPGRRASSGSSARRPGGRRPSAGPAAVPAALVARRRCSRWRSPCSSLASPRRRPPAPRVVAIENVGEVLIVRHPEGRVLIHNGEAAKRSQPTGSMIFIHGGKR